VLVSRHTRGDAVDAGGRNGYPSDSQAALNKNYVDLSDESDQADDELALVTSGPVSAAHTRSKCIGASRKGDGGTRPVGDDETNIQMLFWPRRSWYLVFTDT